MKDDVVAEAAAHPKPSDLLGGTTKPGVKELSAKPFRPDTKAANGSSTALRAEYGRLRALTDSSNHSSRA